MAKSSPRPAPAEPITVALIDDHAMVGSLLIDKLSNEGTLRFIGSFATAAEGFVGCLKLKPRLVIIDWMLPDGNGMELVRALAPKLRSTRFIFLSGIEKSSIVRQAFDANVHGFVMKRQPYSILLQAIYTVVAGTKKYYCSMSKDLLFDSPERSPSATTRPLTKRERDILHGVVRGEPVKQIAANLGVQAKTVYNQFGLMKEKLGIYDIPALVRYAADHGIVSDL